MDGATTLEVSGPDLDRANPCVAVLAAVADPVRWRVLALLAEGQACVCEIQERVQVAGNLLSYHLRVLKDAQLITARRRGRWIDYRLAPDAHQMLRAALPTGGDSR